MEKERSASIVEDSNGNKVVLIKDIRFKGKKKEDTLNISISNSLDPV